MDREQGNTNRKKKGWFGSEHEMFWPGETSKNIPLLYGTEFSYFLLLFLLLKASEMISSPVAI